MGASTCKVLLLHITSKDGTKFLWAETNGQIFIFIRANKLNFYFLSYFSKIFRIFFFHPIIFIFLRIWGEGAWPLPLRP
jgi:hypothetical protein